MFRRTPTTTRTRGAPSTPSNMPPSTFSKHNSLKPKGLFASGIWHCDCNPRLPAERFRVKKDGKNHGRWFYTCQAAQDKRCGFFLWEDDAKVREEGAVLGNSRTEPGREAEASGLGERTFEELERAADGAGTGKGRVQGEANPEWRAAQTQQRARDAAGKRKRAVVALDESETEGEDDELLSWPPTARGAEPETPSKKAKTDVYVTPTTTSRRKLPWLDYSEEDTPTKPAKVDNTGINAIQLPTPSKTRTIDRVQDMVVEPAEPTTPQSRSLQEDVLGLFRERRVELPDAVQVDLRSMLSRYEAKLQGVIKGRDLVRTALKSKDGKMVELQGRIAGLEAEREVLLAAIGRAKDDAESQL